MKLAELGRFEEAAESYEYAIRIDPGNKLAWYGKGLAVGHLGRQEDALECYERSLEIDSANADAW